ncbi:hypothetical protein J2S19_002352 [Metabacillus malikii]|uniref:Uncharacterized protein n=1 Tax=Metabacillus malikii TaxID=1504265 RepID=A0ABT9ZGI4_9BACI|nr:hypothetical protein [Metabacillus malikii]
MSFIAMMKTKIKKYEIRNVLHRDDEDQNKKL